MQILIAYAGKTGTTSKCVEILSQKLQNVSIANLNNREPQLASYDLVIIGSSVRIGKIHSKVKNFINMNKKILQEKKTAYFICCGFSDKYENYFEKNIPSELLDNAIIYDTFGGEIDMLKQKGLAKLIINMVSKSENAPKEVRILTENIDRFVGQINKTILESKKSNLFEKTAEEESDD